MGTRSGGSRSNSNGWVLISYDDDDDDYDDDDDDETPPVGSRKWPKKAESSMLIVS